MEKIQLLENIKMIRDQIRIVNESDLETVKRVKHLNRLHQYLEFVETRYDFVIFSEKAS